MTADGGPIAHIVHAAEWLAYPRRRHEGDGWAVGGLRSAAFLGRAFHKTLAERHGCRRRQFAASSTEAEGRQRVEISRRNGVGRMALGSLEGWAE